MGVYLPASLLNILPTCAVLVWFKRNSPAKRNFMVYSLDQLWHYSVIWDPPIAWSWYLNKQKERVRQHHWVEKSPRRKRDAQKSGMLHDIRTMINVEYTPITVLSLLPTGLYRHKDNISTAFHLNTEVGISEFLVGNFNWNAPWSQELQLGKLQGTLQTQTQNSRWLRPFINRSESFILFIMSYFWLIKSDVHSIVQLLSVGLCLHKILQTVLLLTGIANHG